MTKEPKKEFTFADIILIPGRSDFELAREDVVDISGYLTKKIKIRMPIVSANMSGVTESDMALLIGRLGGIGIIHQFMDPARQIQEVKKVKKGGVIVGAAVFSYGKDVVSNAVNLERAGCDVIVIDSANAYNKDAIDLLKLVRKKVKTQLAIGNIATPEAIKEFARAGADAVKIGIGPGSHCTTRLVTGFGRPQLSLIMECAKISKKFGIPIIADGGISSSGDIVKALALGADTVMIGGLLAGTKESPGGIVKIKGKSYKKTLGNNTEAVYGWTRVEKFSIRGAIKAVLGKRIHTKGDDSNFVEEGVGVLTEYKGEAGLIIRNLAGGVRRGLWYGGAISIPDLQKKVKYAFITESSLREALPRIVEN